jgi:hypothetical protein
MSSKLVLGQITFDAKTFFAVFVKDQNRGRPQDIETVEAGGIFFDMNRGGNKAFLNELCQLRIPV